MSQDHQKWSHLEGILETGLLGPIDPHLVIRFHLGGSHRIGPNQQNKPKIVKNGCEGWNGLPHSALVLMFVLSPSAIHRRISHIFGVFGAVFVCSYLQ